MVMGLMRFQIGVRWFYLDVTEVSLASVSITILLRHNRLFVRFNRLLPDLTEISLGSYYFIFPPCSDG